MLKLPLARQHDDTEVVADSKPAEPEAEPTPVVKPVATEANASLDSWLDDKPAEALSDSAKKGKKVSLHRWGMLLSWQRCPAYLPTPHISFVLALFRRRRKTRRRKRQKRPRKTPRIKNTRESLVQ